MSERAPFSYPSASSAFHVDTPNPNAIDELPAPRKVELMSTELMLNPPTPPASDGNAPLDFAQEQVLHELAAALQRPVDHLDMTRSFVRHSGDSIAAIRFQKGCRRLGIHLSLGTILGSEQLEHILDICGSSQDTQVPENGDVEGRICLPTTGRSQRPCSQIRDHKERECLLSERGCEVTDSEGPVATKQNDPRELCITEMQMALLEGSQASPGTNIIQFIDRCATQMLPVMREAWRRVLTSEPIFQTLPWDLSSNSNIATGSLRPWTLDWEEITTYEIESFDSEVQRPPRVTDGVSSSFRAVTLRKGNRRPTFSTIVWNVHHALVDGYSARLLYDKVLAVINHQVRAPGASFITVARQLKALQQEKRAESRKFWEDIYERFPMANGTLTLPKPGRLLPERRHAVETVSMDGLVDPVSTPSRCGVSVAALFHAAWALVLSLYIDSDQVVFGAVLSGRSLSLDGADDTIGPLINTLPIFINVDPQLKTTQFLRRVFQQLIDLDAVQYSIPQDGYTRDFSTALSEELEMPVSPFSDGIRPTFEMPSDIPLRVFFNRDGGFRISYDPQAHKRSDIQGMAECLKKALMGLLAPVTIETCLTNLVDYEMREILRDMGNCFAEETTWGSIHQDLVTLFEKAVDFDPKAIALEQDGIQVTYQELDDMAGHIASFVAPRIDAGDVVCVNADGSINWIVAIYGILKAGGVYSALSNKLPAVMRDENFRTAGGKLFLVPRTSDKVLKPVSCKTCFSVEDLLASRIRQPWSHRAQAIPWAEAYICFTSGSTGKPKGVVCTHAGLVAFQRDPEVRLFAGPGIRVSQLMSPAFDGSIHEIFSALSYGATLVLGNQCGDMAHLYRVDSVLSTPSMVKELDPVDFPRLKYLYMVGENVPQSINDIWARSQVAAYNMYGPTEATCGATIKQLRPGLKVNIGRPNPSTRVYILDRNMRMVPPGVAGELYLSGVQVSRGYIGRPDETAEKFRVDRISSHPGEMMYRTGDRGFWNSYGEIELLGRSDRQVKLRGFRVDLNDLEVRVSKVLPSGASVAIAVKQDYLIAMVQPETIDLEDLKRQVAEILPVHCFPKHFMAVEVLPLTPVGKVDYKAVTTWVNPNAAVKKSPSGGSQALVELISNVWREVLDVADGVSIGEDTSFTSIGGHSLQQMMVANKLSRLLNQKVPHSRVIQAHCLGDLARFLEALQAGEKLDISRDQHVHPTGEVFPIERDWWEKYRTNTGTSAFNVSFVCSLDTAVVELDRLKGAWNTVLGRHEILRCRYEQDVSGNIKRVYAACPPQLQSVPDVDIEAEINKEFSLSDGPLVRVKLSPTHLVVCISHIICDLTALETLLGEVKALYNLENLTQSPRAYSQRDAWNRDISPSDLKFWRETLGNIPESSIHRQSRVAYSNGTSAMSQMPSCVSKSLFECCRKGFTCHQVALAAVALALTETGKDIDLVLGGPYLGRSHEDITTVGLFLEPLPFRIQYSEGSTDALTPYLEAVKVASQLALAHAVPWNQLISELGIVSSFPNQPLLDTMVTFHPKNGLGKLVPNGVEPLITWTHGAKFKLMFEFMAVSSEAILLRIEYDTDLFNEAEIRVMHSKVAAAVKLLASGSSWSEARARFAEIEDGSLESVAPDNFFGTSISNV